MQKSIKCCDLSSFKAVIVSSETPSILRLLMEIWTIFSGFLKKLPLYRYENYDAFFLKKLQS